MCPIYIFDSYIYIYIYNFLSIYGGGGDTVPFIFSIVHDLVSALGHMYVLVGALLFCSRIINLLLKSWETKVMDDHRGDLLS